ncbi:unnamed protein product [Trichogramma brassicae]|uniref:Uncharacterized protein n=1 Tax=Trichogramma brassicae TaxID=86971 RepID=A0A6H5HXC2_9HYME|nr:unnamed protein product [Trichogramma brassicae]
MSIGLCSWYPPVCEFVLIIWKNKESLKRASNKMLYIKNFAKYAVPSHATRYYFFQLLSGKKICSKCTSEQLNKASLKSYCLIISSSRGKNKNHSSNNNRNNRSAVQHTLQMICGNYHIQTDSYDHALPLYTLNSIIPLESFVTRWANQVLMALNENVIARVVLREVMLNQDLFPQLRNFLYYALQARYLEVVRFLLEQVGLDIHGTRFANGTRSAIHELANFAAHKLQRGRVSLSSLEIFDYFFAASRENHRDAEGCSYLHATCVAGDLATVRGYLEQGADVNAKTWHWLTPLRIATRLRYVDVARCLLDRGADLEGSTLLYSLARTQMCSCLEYCEPFGQYCNKKRPVEDIADRERGEHRGARP